MQSRQTDFDHIARPYRWLEYLTLGRALERCRQHFLPELRDRTTALVLGDGDGRFLARLFAQNPKLQADAVDISGVMLELLRERCPPGVSLRTYKTGALEFLASHKQIQYDLVVSHFFLDCFTQSEVDRLAADVAARLTPGALWLTSDFAIPSGVMRVPADLLVRLLYFAFRVLTGLRVDRLPDHRSALQAAGFSRIRYHASLGGVLISEIWKWDPNAAKGAGQ